MAVKPDRAGGVATASYAHLGFCSGQRFLFGGYSAHRPMTPEEVIEGLREGIDQDARAMNEKMVALVRMLADRGAWCEVVRLVVGVGGYRPAELAEVLSVMRSTVTRWYNCETKPQEVQIPIYAKRLLAYMERRRPIERIVDPKDLIKA